MSWPILSILTFLPMTGALFLFLIRGDDDRIAQNARVAALWVSGFTFGLSLIMANAFDPALSGYQMEDKGAWLALDGIGYRLGIDGISMPLILLTTFLVPLAIVASRKSITSRVREYMIAFLVLESLMIGTFCSLNLVLFYLFFEAVLIPMFLIIGIWGGKRRIYASFKFFLYTLAGSVLLLVAMLYMTAVAGTADIPALHEYRFGLWPQLLMFLALFASFAVKLPMWPLHTWLPDAHVEAPTGGSMILAGVLLKMGGYGFLRLSLPILPDASAFFAPMMFILSVIAVVYTSLVALAQTDMKKLIAYSSVAHMGFVTIGIFTLSEEGISGAMFQMLSHGLISAALFFCVGVVYDRLHTRDIDAYGGVAASMPRYASFFMVMMLASVGLPGTSGFVGEFLVLLAAWQESLWLAAATATGVVLGACYMLWLYRRVMFGPGEKKTIMTMSHLDRFELAIFALLAVPVIFLGILPGGLLGLMEPSIEVMLAAMGRGG